LFSGSFLKCWCEGKNSYIEEESGDEISQSKLDTQLHPW